MSTVTLDEFIIRVEAKGTGEATMKIDQVGKKVADAKRDISSSMSSLSSGMAAIGDKLGGYISNIPNILKNVGIAGAGVAVGLGAIAFEASKAASEFDHYERIMKVFLGSAKAAGDMMAWIQDFSGPSVFGFTELAEAGSRLAALRLNPGQWLPIVDAVASVSGDSQDLIELVGALGRLRAGQFGEALESLRRFGISNEDWASQGLTFDAGGQLKGSTQQVMDAVFNIVTSRFGAIRKELADSPAAKWASATDAWTRSMKQLGDVVNAWAMPIIEKMTGYMDYLGKSGIITNIANGFASMFDNGDVGSALVKGLSWIVAAMNNMPNVLKNITNWFKDTWDAIAKGAKFAVAALAGFGAYNLVMGLIKVVETVMAIAKAVKSAGIAALIAETIATRGKALAEAGLALGAAWLAAEAINTRFDSFLPKIPTYIIGDTAGDIIAEQKKVINAYNQSLVTTPVTSTPPKPIDNRFVIQDMKPYQPFKLPPATDQKLAGIEKNTRESADALQNLRADILGGGQRARAGSSSLEVQIALGRALGIGIG